MKIPRPVSKPVSTCTCAASNSEVRSYRKKPKEDPNHRENPGEEKTGRVNVSESSMRLRNI